jgi:hypothetical protein
MLRAHPRTSIVIDALDECPEPIRLAPTGLLLILKKLVDLQIDNVSIFMTSRPALDIRAHMITIPRRELNINSSSHHTDNLALFISREISGYRGWTELDKVMVNSNLNSRADGMQVARSQFDDTCDANDFTGFSGLNFSSARYADAFQAMLNGHWTSFPVTLTASISASWGTSIALHLLHHLNVLNVFFTVSQTQCDRSPRQSFLRFSLSILSQKKVLR